ncbi:hypothetical protein H9P43_006262 [Blastocladiella emersonii ATCC 22665]|nr:hypothetical protein H9P43_006262 [Blastocladiella emersonii ATCC 22665]
MYTAFPPAAGLQQHHAFSAPAMNGFAAAPAPPPAPSPEAQVAALIGELNRAFQAVDVSLMASLFNLKASAGPLGDLARVLGSAQNKVDYASLLEQVSYPGRTTQVHQVLYQFLGFLAKWGQNEATHDSIYTQYADFFRDFIIFYRSTVDHERLVSVFALLHRQMIAMSRMASTSNSTQYWDRVFQSYPLEQHPMPLQVAFRAFRGRQSLVTGRLQDAEDDLKFAFYHSSRRCQRNLQMLLSQLITVRLSSGASPSLDVLQRYGIAEPWVPVIHAIRGCNFPALEDALDAHAPSKIWAELFAANWTTTPRYMSLKHHATAFDLLLGDTWDSDIESTDAAAMRLSSMIAANLVRGYVHYGRRIHVLPSKPPVVPSLSSSSATEQPAPAPSTWPAPSQPSGFGAGSGFGAPAVGQSTGFGFPPAAQAAAPSGFGVPAQPSAFGAPAAPSAFGAPAAPTGFGAPAAPSASGAPAAGAPSTFGASAPSAFGAPASAAPSAFGATAPSAFGATAPSAFGSAAPSAFGASAPSAFSAPAAAASPFGAPAGAPAAFNTPETPSPFGGPSAFGAPASGAPSAFGGQAPAFGGGAQVPAAGFAPATQATFGGFGNSSVAPAASGFTFTPQQ